MGTVTSPERFRRRIRNDERLPARAGTVSSSDRFTLLQRMGETKYFVTTVTEDELAIDYQDRLISRLPQGAEFLSLCQGSASGDDAYLFVKLPACLADHLGGRYTPLSEEARLETIFEGPEGAQIHKSVIPLRLEEGLDAIVDLMDRETCAEYLSALLGNAPERARKECLRHPLRSQTTLSVGGYVAASLRTI